MKRSVLLVPALGAALLAPALPAVAAPVASSAPASQTNTTTALQEAEQSLALVDARLAELTSLQQTLDRIPEADRPKVDYRTEIRNLVKTALELRGTIEAIVAGRVPAFDMAIVKPRVELFLLTAQTIHRATTELTTKVDTAHIELGFCITRAVLRLVNPTATVEMINESKQDVQATFERVSTYPDLQPTDRATIYVKDVLNTKIWEIRISRDRTLLGKKPEGYRQVNRQLTHAVGVWFDAGATVAEVQAEIAALDAVHAQALKA
ncbi:CAMP factor family pore-forming toxin [Luteococcus sp. Sow4_B9]|uniref:CAMP factor family pore-forming toxin n=1 Tax=Luteococcus sp. Sow4_B9 TaxID=3438792 RepID=UPI003F96BB2A